MGEAANERGGVEILHDGDAKFRHGWFDLQILIIAKQGRDLPRTARFTKDAVKIIFTHKTAGALASSITAGG